MFEKSWQKLSLALVALMAFSGFANATAIGGTTLTDLADTIDAFAPVLTSVSGLIPEITDVLVAFAILLGIVAIVGGIVGLIVSIMSINKIMAMVNKRK